MLLNFNIGARRTVSLVVTLALMQAGVVSSALPVLAQLEETTSGAVYQSSSSPSGVAEAVYGVPQQKPNLPPPLTFLTEKLSKNLLAAAGTFAVSGQITENSTRMPIAGVTVQLLLDGHPTQFKTSTDTNGNYTLTGVGVGQYLLTFQHPGYAPEQFDLDIKEADVRQNCGLYRNTSFKGQVTNQRGDALEGVQVSLSDQNTPDRDIQLLTNGDGWFYLVDVPPGRYRLSVSQSVYHKEKAVWVDEYPQELTVVLPVPVSDAVQEGNTEAIPTEGSQSNPDSDSAGAGEQPPVEGDQPTAGQQPAVEDQQPPVDGQQPSAENQQLPAGQQPPVEDQQPSAGAEPSSDGTELPQVSEGYAKQSSNYTAPNIRVQSEAYPSGRSNQPSRSSAKWFPEIIACRESGSLSELERLLEQQATIS